MIRFARIEDVDEIMAFINKHWKAGHILATNKDFFLYELQNVDDPNQINMAIARDDKTNELVGIDGIYYYGKRLEGRDTSGCMWKVIKSDNPVLGIDLFQFVMDNTRTRCIVGVGLGRMAIPIHKYLKFEVDVMTHWYRLNPNIKDFKIALVTNPKIPQSSLLSQAKFVRFPHFENLNKVFDFEAYYESKSRPTKEDWYIKRRYFDHPIYTYEVFGIELNGAIKTICVFRIESKNNAKALRFVDLIGEFEHIYYATQAIDELLLEYNAEYVDFYEHGLDISKMENAGWLLTKPSGNIIPNYFYPFVQENIDIYYGIQDENYKVFKADGDQDRPN